MNADQIRQLRGLIIHCINKEDKTSYGRECFFGFGMGNIGDKRNHGTCKWCFRQTEGRRLWHPGCVSQYSAAKGSNRKADGLPVLDTKEICAKCGNEATEIDHILALSLARHHSWRVYVKAHALANLQWLCRACHKEKTKIDKGILAKLNFNKILVQQKDRLLVIGFLFSSNFCAGQSLFGEVQAFLVKVA